MESAGAVFLPETGKVENMGLKSFEYQSLSYDGSVDELGLLHCGFFICFGKGIESSQWSYYSDDVYIYSYASVRLVQRFDDSFVKTK
jgi:hypothetical protein